MLVLFSAVAARAQDTPYHIFYAEPIDARIVADTAAAKPESGAGTLSFEAYGRQFDLDLEPNARLLSTLPTSSKGSLARTLIYKGRMRGLNESWVRLTQTGDEIRGAIWDG